MLLICAAVGVSGCATGNSKEPERVTRIAELEVEVAALKRQVAEKDEQIRGLSEQVQSLRKLPDDKRPGMLPQVARIELASLSGGIDENNDGVDDGIVVYLRPIDEQGDVIKAAGTVWVRLLDLANPPETQELGRVELNPETLRGTWYGTLTSHYTIKVPWSAEHGRPQHGTVTVIVTFLEYLTGKTFSTQAAFAIRGIPTNASSTQPTTE